MQWQCEVRLALAGRRRPTTPTLRRCPSPSAPPFRHPAPSHASFFHAAPSLFLLPCKRPGWLANKPGNYRALLRAPLLPRRPCLLLLVLRRVRAAVPMSHRPPVSSGHRASMPPGSGDPDPELPDALKCGLPQRPCSPPPPPPPSSSHGRSTFVTALIIAGAVLAVLALCLSLYLFLRLRRRRQRQRQRQQQQEALLEAALAQAPPAAAPAAFPAGGGPGPGEEEVVHHVWHIRTVGLDEAAIESIALTRYRAGPGGVLGAADCAVCLGEFRDGELLRLLPKCGHAFHVPCIDTWLRAHVNCPLCRADVLGPAAADEQPGDPPAGADADADADADRPGLEQPHQHGNERHELRVQIDQRAQSSSPERPHRLHGARVHSFRRVASMDSPSPVASAEEAPEVELSISENEKQGAGGAVRREGATGSSRLDLPAMERSLSVGSRWALLSRHCRTRSSLMPL